MWRAESAEPAARWRVHLDSAPTEAEWEYVARAGSPHLHCNRDGNATTLDQVAWTRANSGGELHPVMQLEPNPWGLYDLYGNVWEWGSGLVRSVHARGADRPVGSTWRRAPPDPWQQLQLRRAGGTPCFPGLVRPGGRHQEPRLSGSAPCPVEFGLTMPTIAPRDALSVLTKPPLLEIAGALGLGLPGRWHAYSDESDHQFRGEATKRLRRISSRDRSVVLACLLN